MLPQIPPDVRHHVIGDAHVVTEAPRLDHITRIGKVLILKRASWKVKQHLFRALKASSKAIVTMIHFSHVHCVSIPSLSPHSSTVLSMIVSVVRKALKHSIDVMAECLNVARFGLAGFVESRYDKVIVLIQLVSWMIGFRIQWRLPPLHMRLPRFRPV